MVNGKVSFTCFVLFLRFQILYGECNGPFLYRRSPNNSLENNLEASIVPFFLYFYLELPKGETDVFRPK